MKSHFFKVQLPVLILVIVIATSCKKTLAPEAPDQAEIKKEYKRELSALNLPIVIQIDELQKTINDQFSGVIYEDQSFEDNDRDNLKMKVTKIKDIKLSANGRTLSYSVPLKIWADYRQSLGALSMHKAASMEVILKFKTELDLNKKWELSTKTTAEGYKWLSEPVITLAGAPIKITNIVGGILDEQLQPVADILDQQVKEVSSTRDLMKEVWVEIQKPMLVNEDYSTWLKMEPKKFQMAPIKGDRKKIELNVGMQGYLDVVLGDEPDYSVTTKLPDLIKTKSNPETFHMTIATEVSFESATAILKENLVGYTYEYGKKKKIEVTDCKVFGVGDELGVRVDFDGNIAGQFYLTGTPKYDSATTEIYMDNFNWDIKSKKLILKTADWLLHGPIKNRIEGYMRYPLDSTIIEYTELAEKSLQDNPLSDNIHLHCDIEKVYPTDILMTQNGIKTYLYIEGRAKLLYGKKD